MPSERATLQSESSGTSKKRRLSKLTLAQKVIFTRCFLLLLVFLWLTRGCDHSHCLPGIFGGVLLGVKSRNGLAFYDWERAELMRRVIIQPRHVGGHAHCISSAHRHMLRACHVCVSVLAGLLVRLRQAGLHCDRRVVLCAALPARGSGCSQGVQDGHDARWIGRGL